MVIVKNEPALSNRHIHFRGLTEAFAIDCEEGLFAALLEIAYHHTVNDIEIYENEVINSNQHNQKSFFLQLIFRKKDVINRLKMYRSEFYLGHATIGEHRKRSSPKNPIKKSFPSPEGVNEAFQFAFQRENRSLALFSKLKESMGHDSTKALFDYLISAQNDCILYLTTECSEKELALNGTASLRKDDVI
jgi:hypothetical protein